MITGERIVLVISAVVVVLLQVLLAPHLAIGYAFPCFVMAFCLATAIVRYEFSNPVMPFILGLVFDLASGGPVGAMALSLTVTTVFAAWLNERMSNDTLFMSILVLAIGTLAANLLYGLVFLMLGYAASPVDAFVYRIAPSFVYDFVLALVMYALASRLFGGETVSRTEIKQL